MKKSSHDHGAVNSISGISVYGTLKVRVPLYSFVSTVFKAYAKYVPDGNENGPAKPSGFVFKVVSPIRTVMLSNDPVGMVQMTFTLYTSIGVVMFSVIVKSPKYQSIHPGNVVQLSSMSIIISKVLAVKRFRSLIGMVLRFHPVG